MSKKNHIKKPPIWQTKDPFLESLELNQITYNHYFNLMKNIWMTLYQWENLPDTMNQRYIENVLFYSSGIAVFNDEIVQEFYGIDSPGLLNLPFNIIGYPDIYGNPQSIQVYSDNGYYRTLEKADEYVIIWGNYNRIPPYESIAMFARRMYETARAIDVNIRGQKTPKIIVASEGQKLSMQNMVKQIEGNIANIFVKDNYAAEDMIKSVDTTAPYVADKLDVHQHQIMNEFLTFCGIENSNMDKKERLVSDEVNSNYGSVEVIRNTGLMTRQEAAESINKKFGTDIKVSFQSKIATLLNAAFLPEKEGEEDSDLYNNTVGTGIDDAGRDSDAEN